MAMKAARDKEQLQTELDVVKDRWDKVHMVHQKLQVIKSFFYFLILFSNFVMISLD